MGSPEPMSLYQGNKGVAGAHSYELLPSLGSHPVGISEGVNHVFGIKRNPCVRNGPWCTRQDSNL